MATRPGCLLSACSGTRWGLLGAEPRAERRGLGRRFFTAAAGSRPGWPSSSDLRPPHSQQRRAGPAARGQPRREAPRLRWGTSLWAAVLLASKMSTKNFRVSDGDWICPDKKWARRGGGAAWGQGRLSWGRRRGLRPWWGRGAAGRSPPALSGSRAAARDPPPGARLSALGRPPPSSAAALSGLLSLPSDFGFFFFSALLPGGRGPSAYVAVKPECSAGGGGNLPGCTSSCS